MAIVCDYPGEPVPEETFTHSHLCSSSIILYQLPPSTTIHSILPVQFMCLTVFLHNLSPSHFWSPSWSEILYFILHFFHPIVVFFSQHMSIPSKHIAIVPRLCDLFTWNSVFCLNATHPSDHSHLCPLKCQLIFFPTSQVSLSFHATLLYIIVLSYCPPFADMS